MSINRLQRPRLVLVGNGMAGMRTVEALVARAPDRIDITVIGGEPHPSYNRILLSSVLAGERTLAEIPPADRCLHTKSLRLSDIRRGFSHMSKARHRGNCGLVPERD